MVYGKQKMKMEVITMAKILIVYYSRKGENYWNGGLKHIDKGNTERVAEFIQKAVGGDLFEVDLCCILSEQPKLTRWQNPTRHSRQSARASNSLGVSKLN